MEVSERADRVHFLQNTDLKSTFSDAGVTEVSMRVSALSLSLSLSLYNALEYCKRGSLQGEEGSVTPLYSYEYEDPVAQPYIWLSRNRSAVRRVTKQLC